MNLKEFDAKQFLLEKGEQVGLGVALTLMVLMLIFSLFMPDKGFFSGSPVGKATPLKKGADDLEVALRTKEPSANELPEPTANRLIDLDTSQLQPRFYETLSWFAPAEKENPARRPPIIFNVVEARAEPAYVPIDSYIFNKNFTKIMVLRDPDKKVKGADPGGRNPLAAMLPPGMSPGGGGRGAQRARSRFNNPGSGQGVQGVGGETDYVAQFIDVTAWNPMERTARQLMPARLTYIAATFPYKAQLEEFKRKLKLRSIDEALNETSGEGDDKRKSFSFLGVKVQRKEVDASGHKVADWTDLDLGDTYRVWLMNSGKPFEQDDDKYVPVSFKGLVAPLLRQFHEKRESNPSMRRPGMMQPGMMAPGATKQEEGPGEEIKKKYPDVAANLPKLQETLRKLDGVAPKLIAAPPENFRVSKGFDPFNPDVAPPAADQADGKAGQGAAQGLTIPDYCLVRLIDITIEPGKFYRYRFKIRMANPNYKRDDVASPTYKKEEALESRDWYELPDTVGIPPELIYYVVDEKQFAAKNEKMPPGSAQAKLWTQRTVPDSVVMQFHRWVESVPTPSKDEEKIGDWAIADRVSVVRGEYVGRKVKVDLPIWQFAKNAFVLPAEEATGKRPTRSSKPSTGIDVDFGQDGSDKETILVDFEGGKVHHEPKIDDNYRIEVLMLDADGKLLARNSAKDAKDAERQERRKMVLERIKNVREGKNGE